MMPLQSCPHFALVTAAFCMLFGLQATTFADSAAAPPAPVLVAQAAQDTQAAQDAKDAQTLLANTGKAQQLHAQIQQAVNFVGSIPASFSATSVTETDIQALSAFKMRVSSLPSSFGATIASDAATATTDAAALKTNIGTPGTATIQQIATAQQLEDQLTADAKAIASSTYISDAVDAGYNYAVQLNSAIDTSVKNDTTDLTSAHTHSLSDLTDLDADIQTYTALHTDYTAYDSAAASLAGPGKKTADTADATLSTDIKTCLSAVTTDNLATIVKPQFQAAAGGTAQPLETALSTQAKTVTADLQSTATSSPPDSTELLKAAQTNLSNLASLVSVSKSLLVDISGTLDFQSSTQTVTLVETAAETATNSVQTATSQLKDAISGVNGSFITEQIRLFYDTDVHTILQQLNPNLRELDPSAFDQRDKLATLEKNLRTADVQVAEKFAAVNDLKTKLKQVEEQVREQQAIVKSDNIHAQQAQQAVAAYTAQDDNLKTQIGAISPTSTAPGDQAKLIQLNAAEADVAAKLKDQTTAASTAQTSATQAQTELSTLTTEQNSLPTLQEQADTNLETAQQTLQGLRADAASDAYDVNAAFAASRDNQPVWIADADSTSPDPGKQVILYGYPDSSIIEIRGLPKNVELVKRVISDFDRPAPQARITIYTMQMSGSDPVKIGQAINNYDQTLRDLRSNITLVQDVLRDSINREVNRWEDVAYTACLLQTNHQVRLPDRLARYFFYPKEIRNNFGMTVDVHEIYQLSEGVVDELEIAKEYYERAVSEQTNAELLENSASFSKTNIAELANQVTFRTADLRRADYHLNRARRTWASLEHELLDSYGVGPMDLKLISYELAAASPIGKTIAPIGMAVLSNDGNALDSINSITKNVNSLKDSMRGSNNAVAFEILTLVNNIHSLECNFPSYISKYPHTPDPDSVQAASCESLTKFTLPDPAHGTTLGEMFFVLSLGNKIARENIVTDFLMELQNVYMNARSHNSKSPASAQLLKFINDYSAQFGGGIDFSLIPGETAGPPNSSDGPVNGLYPSLPRTLFGSAVSEVANEDNMHEMTSNQLEIEFAMKSDVLASVSSEVRQILHQIDTLHSGTDTNSTIASTKIDPTLTSASIHYLRDEYLPLVGWLKWCRSGSMPFADQGDANVTSPSDETGVRDWSDFGARVVSTDRATFEINAQTADEDFKSKTASDTAKAADDIAASDEATANVKQIIANTADTAVEKADTAAKAAHAAANATNAAAATADAKAVRAHLFADRAHSAHCRAKADAKFADEQARTADAAAKIADDAAQTADAAATMADYRDKLAKAGAKSAHYTASLYNAISNTADAIAKTPDPTGNTPAETTKMADDIARTADVKAKTPDAIAFEVALLTYNQNGEAMATPREAAADDMIKRMIVVAENDLENYFTAPSLEHLQLEVSTTKGVTFGQMQVESILATNRQQSRLDPSGNASIASSAPDNVLESAQQLGDIVQTAEQDEKAAKVTAGLPVSVGTIANTLGDLSQPKSIGLGVGLSLLADLATQPQPVGTMYSLNSGDVFQVTPIFDPSGQALRFKFDYVASTRLTEPNGSTDPNPAAIDRVSVNTEAQLSNLEYREIARYENNAQVGTPSFKSGGLPVLNQLPIIKDIPILGYFVKGGSKGATRQESLIFAQTSIYPTVGDIVGLLTDEAPRPYPSLDVPAYLTK